MNAPSAYKLEHVMSAWMAARERLGADPDLDGDEHALSSLLGPEDGDVRDILSRVLSAAQHAARMAEGASEAMSCLAERRDRYKRRADHFRSTALQIMEVLGERKAEFPFVTATVRAGLPHVVITDPDALEERFIRTKREPDKAALLTALKDGEVIEGAIIGNTAQTIQLRSK